MKTINALICTLLPAMAAISVSCSESEDFPQPVTEQTLNEIRFAAGTEYSRAGDITTNSLTSFNVYAYTDSSTSANPFMDNITVTKSGTNVWTYSPVMYWPENKTVDFYAFAPATWVGPEGPLRPVAYDATSGKEDIVYAVSPDMKGSKVQPNAQVIFNFRHALSKLTVKMSSSDTLIRVTVSNVAMSNIMTKGNFTFPKGSTSAAASPETVGSWSDQNTPQTYMLRWTFKETSQLDLTTTPTIVAASGTERGGQMYVLPQPLTWRSNGSGNDTFIAVTCSIYNAETGAKLWPNSNTPDSDLMEGSKTGDGILRFPLSTSKYAEWQPGCHYIYNLVVNSNEEMGIIDFGTPTVETFIEVETTYD